MARAPRRRSRRPRWVFLAAVLTLIVLAVNAVQDARDDGPSVRLAQVAYLDRVRPSVERSTEQGADLVRVKNEAARLGRAAVGRRLDQVSRDAWAALRAVREADPPESLEMAHDLLVATMTMRARATDDTRNGLTRALGTDPAEPAVATLARVGRDMATADGTYHAFLDAVPRVDGKPAGAMPRSTWLPAGTGGWSEGELAAYVQSLRSSMTLAPVHDVAVALVTIDPAPVAKEGDASVLPAVRVLRLQIVVANTGNEAERRVQVLASLTAEGVADTARDFVDLAPGQQATVVLGGLRPVAGTSMTLTVGIGPVDGETRVEDNQTSIPVVFR
jgi:hypothetical protein